MNFYFAMDSVFVLTHIISTFDELVPLLHVVTTAGGKLLLSYVGILVSTVGAFGVIFSISFFCCAAHCTCVPAEAGSGRNFITTCRTEMPAQKRHYLI